MKKKCFVSLLIVVAMLFTCFNAAAAGEQELKEKEITLLTWNIPFLEETIMGWIEDFEQDNPGYKVQWIDKHGTEIDSFLMTQLAAGEMPDVIDFQALLYAKYAEMGALAPLDDMIFEDPDTKDRFNRDLLEKTMQFDGKTYEIPFYLASTLLYYNIPMLEKAGLNRPPETFDELVEYAEKTTTDRVEGFMTLNFNWSFWPVFKASGVDFLTPDMSKAAFNTPRGVETVKILKELTEKGAISKLSWTGRWAELNDTFSSQNVAMFNSNASTFHNVKEQDWVSPETLGLAPFLGGWKQPNQHGLAMSSQSEHPEAAWELMKVITNAKWAKKFASLTALTTGNLEADKWYINQIEDKPLESKLLNIVQSDQDKFTGNFALAENERLFDAFFSEIQKALVGDATAEEALDSAETAVNNILKQ